MLNATIERKLKVAGYCKVKADKGDYPKEMLNTKAEILKRFIEGHREWELVKVYADIVDSTKPKKRKAYKELVKDCHKGKVEKIIVKSLTSISRNTVEVLKFIKEMKDLNISIYFESEMMDTSYPYCDTLIKVLEQIGETEKPMIKSWGKVRIGGTANV